MLRLSVCWLSVSYLLCLPCARAQLPAAAGIPAPAPAVAPSDYEAALSEALSAHARGDYAQARIFMERAHQLEPSARTLRGLGIVAFAQGRHLEAIRYLDQALVATDKPLSPELRAGVEELLGHAWGQVGRYELLLDPPSGDFLIDGAAPDLYAPHTVVLAPGNHVLTARAPARAPYELALAVKPGEQRTLHVVLAVPPAPLVGPTAAGEAPSEAERGSGWTARKRWLTLATGAALVASGALTWGLAYSRLQRIADDCRSHADAGCSEAQATGEYRRQNVAGLGISSGILLGGGAAVLLGVGAIELWHAAHRARGGALLRLRPGLGALALDARF